MSKIIVPLHFAKLTTTPNSVETGFKKFYLKGEWFKLYNGISEIDVVLDRPLDNYTPLAGTITSNDTVLTAIEKLDYAIGNINPNVLWGSIGGALSAQTDLMNYLSSNYVPTTRTLTINGVPYDLSADRSWTITAGVWGSITGTITSQTDLINYLSTNYYPLSSNPAGYITSAALAPYLTSATAAATYYPLTNPAGYITAASLPTQYLATAFIDSYTGDRLKPADPTSNGFLFTKSVNGAIGYGAVNSNTGNGAVATLGVGINPSNIYADNTYIAQFSSGYYVPLLAGQGGLLSSTNLFVGTYGTGDINFVTGTTFAGISSKLKILNNGQIQIGTTPNTGTTSDFILLRDTSGNVKQIAYPTIPGTIVTSVTATSPITSSGGTTPNISTSMNTNKLIGRTTAGTGVMEEISVGSGLTLSGGTLDTNPSSSITHATASGTDTYTATVTGVTSYADGDAYLVRFTNGNTTSCTLNINGLGAIPLYRNNDGQLIGGDIIDNSEMLCVYNSTLNVFQTIGTAPNTLLSYVTNADSVTITKGQVVYAFGGQGDRMTVKLAYNTSDATSARTVGVVLSASIGVNQKGLIMMQGLLDGLSILPTATYSDGDPIYLGATPGSITNIKPYAPNHLVYVATVTTANNGSAGRMYVNIQNGYELDELHNVQAQSPTYKDTLWYDNTVSPAQWKTASIPTILGYTPPNLGLVQAMTQGLQNIF